MEQFQVFLEQFHTSGAADAYRYLGCHPEVCEGTEGFVFRTWAPQAQSAGTSKVVYLQFGQR
jgi:1,4-alpha-glucan branching enzyme